MDDQSVGNPYVAPAPLPTQSSEKTPLQKPGNLGILVVMVVLIYVTSGLFFPVLTFLDRYLSNSTASPFMGIVIACFFCIAAGWAMLMVMSLLSPLPLVARTILGLALTLAGWCVWLLGTQTMKNGPNFDECIYATAMFASGVIGGISVVSLMRFKGRWRLEVSPPSEFSPSDSSLALTPKRLSIAEMLVFTAVMSILFAAIRIGLGTNQNANTQDDLLAILFSVGTGAVVTIPTICSIGLMCGKPTKRLKMVTVGLFVFSNICTLAATFFVFTDGALEFSRIMNPGRFGLWLVVGIGVSVVLFIVTFGYGKILSLAGVRLLASDFAGSDELQPDEVQQ